MEHHMEKLRFIGILSYQKIFFYLTFNSVFNIYKKLFSHIYKVEDVGLRPITPFLFREIIFNVIAQNVFPLPQDKIDFTVEQH